MHVKHVFCSAVTAYKEPNSDTTCVLHFKAFFKPTDTHQLLHSKSFHPIHTVKDNFKSEILRIQGHCSTCATLYQACSVFFKALVATEYTRRFLRRFNSETLRHLNSCYLGQGLEPTIISVLPSVRPLLYTSVLSAFCRI